MHGTLRTHIIIFADDDLPPDNPTRMARWVDNLLEWDRFRCPPHKYEVGSSHWTWADMTNRGTNV